MNTLPAWLVDNPVGTTISPENVRARLVADSGWEARARALMRLGDDLPALPESACTDANRLHGCQASVWVVHGFDAQADRLYINCDSDARVVKGLLACILCGYNGQSPAAVQAFDAKAFLHDLHLEDYLASERRNGLLAMIGRVRMLAHRYTA